MYKKELEKLKNVIVEAGEAVMEFYGSENEVKDKGFNSPVTQADLASEKVIFSGLKEFGYPFLSEETEDDRNRLGAERIWIIDPLDGTKDFLQQTGDFTIMVGLVENGQSVLGCVYKPDEKLLYFAVKGEGAYRENNGSREQLMVSDRKHYSAMKMLVSRNHILPFEKGFAKRNGIREMITCGSAGLKICKIAEGSADIYINSSDRTYEWDICAADVIVREAGGSIETLEEEKILFNKDNPRNLEGFIVRN